MTGTPGDDQPLLRDQLPGAPLPQRPPERLGPTPTPACPVRQAVPQRIGTWAGPVTTVAVIGGLDLGLRHGVALALPGMVFLAAVVVSAYLSGLRAGLSSAVLILGYVVLPGAAASPWAIAPDTAPLRVLLLAACAPSMALLVGLLKERTRRQLRALQASVAQLEDANRQLAQLSFVDSLTAIANRRHFDAALAAEWARAGRHQRALALLLIDIDDFKAYNDVYGHPAGDAALQQVAGVLRHSRCRAADLVARYGGEEFAVLLPDTSEAGALLVAEQLRHAVLALRIHQAPTRGQRWLSVSLGVAACRPTPLTAAATLVAAADAALYQAKHAGRNRVHPARAA